MVSLHLRYALNAPDYFTARGAAVIAWVALFHSFQNLILIWKIFLAFTPLTLCYPSEMSQK